MKMKRVLACFAALAILMVSLPVLSSAETYARVISSSVLHLRSLPGTDGFILGKYRTGTRVQILYNGYRNWARVRTPDGKTGYMYKSYLSGYTTSSSSSSSSSGRSSSSGSSSSFSATQYIRTGIGPVNFRKNASSNSKLIDQIAGGTRVTVLSQGSTWSRILYNGNRGYVKTKYLTTKRK